AGRSCCDDSPAGCSVTATRRSCRASIREVRVMSRSWKLLVISTLVAVAGAWLLGSPPARPPVALAEDCAEDARGSLVIRIFDTATDAQLSIGGTTVLVKPDPRDFDLDYL